MFVYIKENEMKKVALSLLAFALVGAMAFGQDAAPAAPVVTISDWGRQIFSVGNITDKDGTGVAGSYAGVGTSWATTPRIVGLNIQAKTDTVGFSITPSADNGTFGLTDQNKAWINPMPGVQVETGISMQTDTWRDTADFGSWDWLRFQGTAGDSWAFKRLGGGGGMATDINYNKDGVGAWALWQQGGATDGQAVNGTPATQLQVGAAYLIPAIGTIKAQYLGNNVKDGGGIIGAASKTSASGVINAAFDWIGTENLTENVGLYIPTASSDLGYVLQVADYTGYKMDKVKLNLMVGFSLPQTDNKGDSGLSYMGGVGADYDLGDSMTVGGDIRYTDPIALGGGVASKADGLKNGMTGFMVDLTKGFSNGLIGVGFEYSTIAIGATPQKDNSAGHWAIPVRLEEWF
jgi:hypothetical protein